VTRVRWFQHQHGVRLAVCAETSQVGEGRMGTEAVVGVVRADLEPTCWYDEPFASKLSAEPLAPPPSPNGSRKVIWKLPRVGRPTLGDELLEGVGEGYLAVRQLRPTIAHACHSCTRRLLNSEFLRRLCQRG
jgi:hypothetical protein